MDDLKPVAEFRVTGKAMNATSEITRKLAGVSARVNAVLEFGDPEHYAEAVLLREKLKKMKACYNNLSTEDILVMREGRFFITGIQCFIMTPVTLLGLMPFSLLLEISRVDI